MRKIILALLAAFGLLLVGAVPATGSASELNFSNGGNDVVRNADSDALTYGWKWAEVVDVYDATGPGSRYKVSQAVSEWDKISRGLVMRMTSNPAEANITVNEVADTCGVGCAYFPPVNNGIATGTCRVELESWYRTDGVAEHVALHEIGHCLGLAHADTTRSVMYWQTSMYDYFTRPQGYDRADIKSLYGR